MSNSKPTVVMAFGTFDYFHAGHEAYLQQAKALGDELIVVVARDETVQRVKGEKPLFYEKKRLRDVLKCTHVNKALLGYTDDKYKVIRKNRPDVIALGYDQFVFTYGLEQLIIKESMNTKIVRLKAFEPTSFKSSLLKSSLQPCQINTATLS